MTDPDTKKTVNQNVSQIVHTTDAYVGIKSPYWNSGKSGAKIDGVVVSSSGKPLVSKKVLLQLVKRDWKVVKKE